MDNNNIFGIILTLIIAFFAIVLMAATIYAEATDIIAKRENKKRDKEKKSVIQDLNAHYPPEDNRFK